MVIDLSGNTVLAIGIIGMLAATALAERKIEPDYEEIKKMIDEAVERKMAKKEQDD